MDLYISPLSCSLAAHIACLEADVAVKIQRVNRKTKLLGDGTDYRSLAPQGIVPAIRLPDRSILTETSAVLQYIADLAVATSLAPRWGTPERYRLIEWIHFISTEIHKKHLFMVFSSKSPDPVKAHAASTAAPPLAHAARRLEDVDYLLGKNFTVADAYLFWALLVAPYGGISIDAYPSLVKYVERIRQRPAVKKALATEVPLYVEEFGALPAPSAA